MLKDIFMELLKANHAGNAIAEKYWDEIYTYYTQTSRHYHTLTHLENMYGELLPVRKKIDDWDTLLFALFYHDIIYKTTSKNNEEKSAEFAAIRLREINYPSQKVELCITLILATKKHERHALQDVNYFTDADLSILGSDTDTYKQYAKQVRKEYAIYPDFIYFPGRKKALQHFLEMDSIFKTDEFKREFEEQARRNIEMELNM